ncbi:hypothetical protein KCP78_16220 [Salmonella enterica subsp. enterica]|nr:hypothetical protein KCP78_16220 [Salmonella enterica subsp. enterica]
MRLYFTYIRYSPPIIGMTVVSIDNLAAGNYVGRRIATRSARFTRRRGVGSNITNILLILGWRRWFVHLPCIPRCARRRELPLMLFVSVVAGSVLHISDS